MNQARKRLLAVARGEKPADLLLAGGSVLDVFTGETFRGDVAIAEGRIASVGPAMEAGTMVDVSGLTLIPGLIDAHVHVESSLLSPLEYARAVVPRGTTAIVCDPHEIANVAGLDGVRWFLEASEGLPLTVLVNAPSCVPASHLATAGASLGPRELLELARHPRVLGLAEVMNVPGAVLGDETVHAKIEAFAGRPVDGHAPGVGGPWLQAYVASGIQTDHECTTAAEAREKLRAGLAVLLRQGTAARNLLDLLDAVTPRTLSRCALCTDDRHPQDLVTEGHLDHLIRLASGAGLDSADAVRMASLSPATIYGLEADRGAIAPGRVADIVACADLRRFEAVAVWSSGRLVAENGEHRGMWPEPTAPPPPGAVRIDAASVDLAVRGPDAPVRLIETVPGQIVTRAGTAHLPYRNGEVLPDPDAGIAKLAVLERHLGTGNTGLGFVRGLGLRRGAIAGTVAHDHHNLVAAGMDDASLRTAVEVLVDSGGGLVATLGDRVLAQIQLPIAGLMSPAPITEVVRGVESLAAAAFELGCPDDPFMTLSFLALEVIPELRLTDLGLVDVRRFELVALFA